MAILRSEEARDMGQGELDEKLHDLRLELAKEQGKIELGSFPENPGRIKEMKRTIARILTVKGEKD